MSFYIIILQALYFFAPSYCANMAPIIVARFKIFESLNIPVDFSMKLNDGEFLFGPTKTWRGLHVGALVGAFIGFTQSLTFIYLPSSHFLYLFDYNIIQAIILGFLLGLGESLGDLFKSFIKRRMHIRSSSLFFPYDQMSFLGALLLGAIIYFPSFSHIAVIIVFSLLLPVAANFIAFKIGWKKVWW